MTEYGRGTKTHMLAVAKKKKILRDIIQNIDDYSVEDLSMITSQPAWIRKHLVTHKQELDRRADGFLTPEEIADLMIEKGKKAK